MPVLSPLFASAVEATTNATTFTAAATTAELANGTAYLVLVTAQGNSDENDSTTEVEVVFGGTRYGLGRWRSAANNAPDSAVGAPIQTAFVVSGDGVSTVAVNLRRLDGPAGTDHFCTTHIACIPLDSLTENTHYWRAEAANGDTLSNPAAGAGWVGSGQQVDVTPGATGNFLILACVEAEHTSGHTATDQMRLRCRVTEDPSGSPTAYNLQRNTVGAIEGPEIALEGGSAWGEVAIGQRFVDVLELTAGTMYRFEPEWEGVTGGGNTGYRRARVFVFDLSVWPEFSFDRDVDGQSGQNNTFGTVSAPAPSSSRDYVLLGSVAYQNGNSWIRAHFDEDPSGTPTRLPATAGFGTAIVDAGTAAADDYVLIGLQWDRQGVTAAADYAINCEADNTNCRWGHERGVFPGGADDGVATLTIAWGMETSTAASGNMTGSSSGTAGSSGDMTGEAALSGGSAGTGGASGTMTAPGEMTGTSDGSSSASGTMSSVALVADDAVIAFVGNSYTQNFDDGTGQGGLPIALQHLLDQRLPGNTTSLGPPPAPVDTVGDADGWYTGLSLAYMTLYPTYSVGGGTADAVDAILGEAPDAYDWVVLTSDFRRSVDVNDGAGFSYEILPGAGGTGNLYGVLLEVVREAVSQLQTGGNLARYIVRMTQEGFNANADTDLSDMERTLRLQTLGARQLVSEGVVDYVSPDHYVWGRLTMGKFGSDLLGTNGPVASYASLTHTNSLQAGGRNYAWCQRSQGTSAPFTRNAHQSALGTIVNAWIWGYALFGIDPRGDTTFDSPAGLPAPLDDMIRADGARIYGGQPVDGGTTGTNGALPYDLTENPAGPPDSELDLEWNATVRGEIQDIIVAAVDDWNAGTTEFDGLGGEMTGTSAGSGGSSAAMSGDAAVSGASVGTAGASGAMTGDAALDGGSAGTGAGSGSMSGSAAMSGASAGSGGGGGTLDVQAPGAMTGSSSGSSSGEGDLEGQAAMSGGSQGSSTAAGTLPGVAGPVTGYTGEAGTTPPADCADTTLPVMPGTPWHVHPEDEGATLTERIVYPYRSSRANGVQETRLEAPVDLSGVLTVTLEYWDGSAWVAITGTGAVESEELSATTTREAGTYYRLTFAPGAGALEVVEADVGRSQSIPRRWALTVAAGDLHLPNSGGYPVISFPALPT